MQGVRKIEKSVVGVRNCVNHLGIKLSNSQARRGQFASGLKIHVILKQGPFLRDNNISKTDITKAGYVRKIVIEIKQQMMLFFRSLNYL